MFIPIDSKNWPRAEIFHYFSKMAPTGYSVTVNIDVTEVLDITKKIGIKFFPAYLWLVTRNLMKQPEFSTALKEGKIGYYDSLTPMYATWHEDTHTFSFMWTEYSANLMDFYKNYIRNQDLYGDRKGVLARPELPPENAYTVSAVPWIEFSHFAVHSFESKEYFFPSIEAGKYHSENGKNVMPLSITCHHATTDGYHVHRFLQDLQKDMDEFEMLIDKQKEDRNE